MLFKNLDLIVCTLAWQPNRFKILFTSRIPAALAPLLSMRTLSGIPFEDSALAKNLVAAGPFLRSDSIKSRVFPALLTAR